MYQDICSGSGYMNIVSVTLKLIQPIIDNPQSMINSVIWLLADSDFLTFVQLSDF